MLFLKLLGELLFPRQLDSFLFIFFLCCLLRLFLLFLLYLFRFSLLSN